MVEAIGESVQGYRGFTPIRATGPRGGGSWLALAGQL
jgi:hypothetical protein